MRLIRSNVLSSKSADTWLIIAREMMIFFAEYIIILSGVKLNVCDANGLKVCIELTDVESFVD